MAHINSFIPGQISLPNYIDVPAVPPPGGEKWYPGQYAKIEVYQMNYGLAANHADMPNPYLPNSTSNAQINSIFGELDRKKWLKGILLEAEWGRIETSDGVYNWTYLDYVFNTIRTLPKASGQNKKVMLLINFKNPGSLTGLEGLLPNYLFTQPAANGGYYKNTTSFPPANTNPVVNAKKYDHLWCYEAPDPRVGASATQPFGYNLNLYKFTDAAGTNTLKTKFYAFLQALYDHFGSDDVFAGIMTTESALGQPFVAYESGNGRNQNYDGRVKILKQMRSVFAGHVVSEDVNFDTAYSQSLTKAGATDGLVANKIAFTISNMNLGTNLGVPLSNINPVLSGKIPIIMQLQGFDFRTMSGNRPQYYNWPTNPTQILGGDGINYNDPPTMQFLFDRAAYFNANYLIIQRNFATGVPNWNSWKTFMDGAIYANDSLGGMDGTKPQFMY